jgi:hypothetical protein
MTDQRTAGRDTKREWVKPDVRRIAAGSAEDSSGPATDAITNPS